MILLKIKVVESYQQGWFKGNLLQGNASLQHNTYRQTNENRSVNLFKAQRIQDS